MMKIEIIKKKDNPSNLNNQNKPITKAQKTKKKTKQKPNSNKPKSKQKIALNRIKELFENAKIEFKNNPAVSKRSVEIARKLANKCKVAIPSEYKRQFCKNCNSFLVPGVNLRVRTTTKTITYTCFNCKKQTRIGYK